MIRLIASDLDDTLLDQDSRLSEENKQVVRTVVEQGVTFTIATGRMFQATVPYAKELGLSEEQPLICYNGALIKRVSGEVLYHRPLPVDLAVKISNYGQEKGWTLNLYYEDELYVSVLNETVKTYASFVDVAVEAVGDLGEFVTAGNKEISKILVISEPEETPGRIRELKKLVGDKVQVTRSRDKFIEITSAEAHKGAALLWLAQSMGLTAEQVMAIGDSGNDITMLQVAGLGVAVENAHFSAKEVADFATVSNSENGVAQALRQFVLQDGKKL